MSEEKKHYQRPLNFKTGKVEMNFGAGGKASAQLIADLFAKNFSNEFLDQGDDGARLPQPKGELIMATDSHVVSPIFFAGGDIGDGPFDRVERDPVMGAVDRVGGGMRRRHGVRQPRLSVALSGAHLPRSRRVRVDGG